MPPLLSIDIMLYLTDGSYGWVLHILKIQNSRICNIITYIIYNTLCINMILKSVFKHEDL